MVIKKKYTGNAYEKPVAFNELEFGFCSFARVFVNFEGLRETKSKLYLRGVPFL